MVLQPLTVSSLLRSPIPARPIAVLRFVFLAVNALFLPVDLLAAASLRLVGLQLVEQPFVRVSNFAALSCFDIGRVSRKIPGFNS